MFRMAGKSSARIPFHVLFAYLWVLKKLSEKNWGRNDFGPSPAIHQLDAAPCAPDGKSSGLNGLAKQATGSRLAASKRVFAIHPPGTSVF